MTNSARSSLLGRRGVLLALALVPLSLGCAGKQSASPTAAGLVTNKVPNGMYAVIGEPTDAPRPPEGPSQRTLRYDPKMADSASTDPVQFVTVETRDFVPLILATAAEHTKQEDGRLLISVALASQYTQTLTDFTRLHLGHRVAMVLDGEVMSTHKVRTVIEGGKMQITRCDEHACQRILSKLVETQVSGKTP